MSEKSPLRVALISRTTSSGGGASRMAEQSAALFNSLGNVRATHYLRKPDGPLFPWQRLIGRTAVATASDSLLKNSLARLGFAQWASIEPEFFSTQFFADHDLVHVHDALDAVSIATCFALSNKLPVVWTLRDCSAFTGGCLYPYDCDNFERSCGACPQLGNWPLRAGPDRTSATLRARRLLGPRLTVLSPTDWMADLAMRSQAFRVRPTVIRNFVDLVRFRPRDRQALRAALGLPRDLPLFLVSAITFGDSRKGADDAMRTIRALRGAAGAVLIGRRCEELAARHPDLPVYPLGWVRDNELLAMITAACDALLFPSRSDNSPNSVIEAMACGIPTVGYGVGGTGELVRDGVDGFLVPPGDVTALTEAARRVVDDEACRQAAGTCARIRCEEQHAASRYISAHVNAYESSIRAFQREDT
jgi:glycosyltransferase involved in cell wall biosynthesis